MPDLHSGGLDGHGRLALGGRLRLPIDDRLGGQRDLAHDSHRRRAAIVVGHVRLPRLGNAIGGRLVDELLVGRQLLESDGRRGGPLAASLGLGRRQLFGDLVEGAAHNAVRVEQTISSDLQLLDLGLAHAPPAGEIGKDPLAHRLRLGHHLATAPPRRFELGLGFAVDAVAELRDLLFRRPPDARRDLLGLLDPPREQAVGFGPHARRLLLGLSHHPGDLQLGASGHVARRLVGRPQHPGRLLTEVGEEGVVVGAGPERTLLQLVDPALQLTLALAQRRELLPDPAEERPYLGGVEPAEARGERVPREVLGRGARIRRDDDAAVVGHCAEAYDSRTRSLRTPPTGSGGAPGSCAASR